MINEGKYESAFLTLQSASFDRATGAAQLDFFDAKESLFGLMTSGNAIDESRAHYLVFEFLKT